MMLECKKTNGAALLFSLVDRRSFQELEKWVDELKNAILSTKSPPIVIFGTKSDLTDKRCVSHDKALELQISMDIHILKHLLRHVKIYLKPCPCLSSRFLIMHEKTNHHQFQSQLMLRKSQSRKADVDFLFSIFGILDFLLSECFCFFVSSFNIPKRWYKLFFFQFVLCFLFLFFANQ